MDKEAIATKRLFPNEEQCQNGLSNKHRLAFYSLLDNLSREKIQEKRSLIPLKPTRIG